MQSSVLSREEPRAMQAVGHGKRAAEESDQKIASRVRRCLFRDDDLDARKNQKDTREDHNYVILHQCCAHRDEDSTNNACSENAVEENSMLILRGYRKIREHHHEDKDVVD